MQTPRLRVVFGSPQDILAQEDHVACGGLFLPTPQPPPHPDSVLSLEIGTPWETKAQIQVRIAQVVPKGGVAMLFENPEHARQQLQEVFFKARWNRHSSPPAVATVISWLGDDGQPLPDLPATDQVAASAPLPKSIFQLPTRAAQTGIGAKKARAGKTQDQQDPPPRPVAGEDLPKEEGTDAADAAEAARTLLDRIRKMGFNEKVQLAQKGDSASRLLLIKDVNKQLQPLVLMNPQITIDEIRYLAGYRQANPEALTIIAKNKEWVRHQAVVMALVRNPKTPLITATHLLDRLPLGEIRRLGKAMDVPVAVQKAARKKANA